MYLLDDNEESVNMRKNIIRLIENKDISSFLLATHLIQSGGLHTDFLDSISIYAYSRTIGVLCDIWLDIEGLNVMRTFEDDEGSEIEVIKCKFLGMCFGIKIYDEYYEALEWEYI